MNKIQDKEKLTDVQMHIEKAYQIIDKHLPVGYVEKVFEKLPKNTKVTINIIQNIRQRKQKASTNLEVFNAIVEVAIENKNNLDSLKKLIA
jgi:hypothetical protein